MRLRGRWQEARALCRLAHRALQIERIQERDAQVDTRDRERAVDLQRLAECVGRLRILELLEQRDAEVVCAIRALSRRVRRPGRARAAAAHGHNEYENPQTALHCRRRAFLRAARKSAWHPPVRNPL